MGSRSDWLTPFAMRVRERSIERWGKARAVEMVGCSDALIDLQTKIEKVAQFNEPVLLVGESGVGKELVAQAIYLLCPRLGKPYVPVNCPQYREGNLTVSELFGHKRGSFTGATVDRKGCFDLADGGVIFLDEIGDLHMNAQVMLLRALASGEFQPLGSETSRRVNVRVVAATNREPEDLRVGEYFRHDLFFRLQYFLIRAPALRDRGDDWLRLAGAFLDKLQAQYGVEKYFSDESLELLSGYRWPGNIRELLSLTTLGYAMADGNRIEPDDFRSGMISAVNPGQPTVEAIYVQLRAGDVSFWDAVHAPFLSRDLNRSQVRSLIERACRDNGGSYRDAMSTMGIASSDYQKFMDFLRHHDLKPRETQR